MDEAQRKERAKWARDLVISVVLVPAFLAWLQMSPVVIVAGGLCSLAILKAWENWPLLRAKFKLGAVLAIFCLFCMFGAGGWYVWNWPAPGLVDTRLS